MGHFGPKNLHPGNSGSAGRIFFKFCTMKGVNRQMKMILIIFQKKLFWANGPFQAQKWHILITLICCQKFFKILHNQKCQQVGESNNNNGLYQKKFVQERWAILSPKMAHPHNSVSTVRIFLKFFVMKGADSYIEVLLVF